MSAISQKLRQGEVTVIDKFELAEVKTKLVASAVKSLSLSGKTLFVLGDYDQNAIKASANIPEVGVCESRLLNVYDIVANKNLVLTVDAIKLIEEDAQ